MIRVAIIALLVIVVVISVPANASALIFLTKLKYSGLDKYGYPKYDLSVVKEISLRQDNATRILDGEQHGNPYFHMNEHSIAVSGDFLQQYSRANGSTYKLPMHIELQAVKGYQHTVIIDRDRVKLEGTGSVDGHTARIFGSASLLKYGNGVAEIVLSLGEIPEW